MPADLLFSRSGGLIWGALRVDGTTVELRVEEIDRVPRIGRIVKARLTNVVEAIGSAFCDIGAGRDGILQGSELLPPLGAESLTERLAPGRELAVQVKRESSRGKGDRVSCRIGLSGPLLVYNPYGTGPGISRRIRDDAERLRLERELTGLAGEGGGFVARTAARGASESALRREAEQLKLSWAGIRQRAKTARAPSVLHEGPALPVSFVRDAWAEGPLQIVLDDRRDLDAVVSYLRPLQPESISRVRLHGDDRPLLDAYGLRREIDRALHARVPLKSGGQLVIEQTEALVAIDVNSGKAIHAGSGGATVLAINLEAAREIARQLRLRDLGGIVVVDFIDMKGSAGRNEVVEAFREAVARDPARIRVSGISDLGLLQLTRKRIRTGIGAVATDVCSECAGEGRIPRS